MDLFDRTTLEVPTQTIEGLDLLDHDFCDNGEASLWNDHYTTLKVSLYLLWNTDVILRVF